MQLVIEIPEGYYKAIKEIPVEQSTGDMIIIQNGIPLPKGHGRLIDADDLIQKLSVVSSRPVRSQLYILREAPTIIEADKWYYESDDYYKGAQEEC